MLPLASLPPNTAIVIVDVQNGFDYPKWGRRNNPQAEANIKRLLELWRGSHMPIMHIQHCSKEPHSPLRPGTPGNAIKDSVAPAPHEPVFKKNVNSAFIGTDLEKILRAKKIETIVLVGLTTDHCISTTARMGANMGFNVYVISDATATFDRRGAEGQIFTAEEVHSVNLASLDGEFATITDTESVIKTITSRHAT